MATLTLVESINLALHEEMRRDASVVVLGEDVGRSGGVFRATAGLLDAFGGDRVLDTPLSESGFVGLAVGAALTGHVRPVVEIQFDTFVYPALEQIFGHVGRFRWRTGGRTGMPIVVRIPFGGGNRAPENHSDSPEAFFCHAPGLHVVCPSTPSDARAMLAAAIREPDPVVFMEPKRLYRTVREDVPDHLPPDPSLWEAAVRRPGTDLTLVSYGPCVPTCLDAAETLAAEGVSAQVLDLRCLSPLDEDAILAAARATGRVVVVHEAPGSFGVGAEVAALVQDRALTSLLAPVGRVTGPDAQFPLMLNEHDYVPDPARVVAAARRATGF